MTKDSICKECVNRAYIRGVRAPTSSLPDNGPTTDTLFETDRCKLEMTHVDDRVFECSEFERVQKNRKIDLKRVAQLIEDTGIKIRVVREMLGDKEK